MLYKNAFYWSTIRNTIVVFGSLFSDIRMEKKDSSNKVVKDIRVPISYAGKEKYIRRFESDKMQLQSLINELELPRMSFEIESISYDSDRKINRNSRLVSLTDNISYEMSPVPYNVELKLHVYTKNQEDMLQIIEQILPFFTPNYTVTLNLIPEMGFVQDVPFILNGVTPESKYSESFEEYRYIINTLSFTAKIHLYGPKETTNIIKIVDVDLGDLGNYKVSVNPTSAGKNDVYTLVEEITENI